MILPHQGVVLMTIAGLSLLITLGLVVGIFGREKRRQAANGEEH